jgi:hypothetical protein
VPRAMPSEIDRLAEIALRAALTAAYATRPEEDTAGHLATARFAFDLAEALHRLAGVQVDLARRSGCTWADVGSAFGVTRQSAHQRFFTRPDLGR